MSHAFTVNCDGTNSLYVSLAPAGSSQIYQAGRVRVSLAGLSGGATAANGLMALVRPVTLTAAPSNPGPGLLTPSTPGTPVNTVVLSTTGERSIQIGQPHQKGFSADAQGVPVGTHLLIKGEIIDSNNNLWLLVEVD